jgi:predicted Holliday junction resolvase-like endonuclease
MSFTKEAKEVIRTLGENRFYVECPCCGEQILLRDASLFYLDHFPPEAEKLYRQQLAELKETKKALRERLKAISQKSEIGAKAVNIGFILERIAPCMKTFCFDHNDCRSLFDPIDYLIFEGLSKKGRVSKIIFADIKTGGSRLKPKQKEIRTLVENKRVEWDTYQTEVRR